MCIEEWQKSHASRNNLARRYGSVGTLNMTNELFCNNNNNESHHMQYSSCKVHVECRKGSEESILGFGENNAVCIMMTFTNPDVVKEMVC